MGTHDIPADIMTAEALEAAHRREAEQNRVDEAWNVIVTEGGGGAVLWHLGDRVSVRLAHGVQVTIRREDAGAIRAALALLEAR